MCWLILITGFCFEGLARLRLSQKVKNPVIQSPDPDNYRDGHVFAPLIPEGASAYAPLTPEGAKRLRTPNP